MTPHASLRTVYFLAFLSLGLFAPYMSLYLQRRGLELDAVAWLLATLPLARMATPPLWGWLADRLESPVRVLRGLAAIASVVTWGYFFAEAPGDFFYVLVAHGLFHSALFPILDASTLALLAEHGGEFGEIRSLGSLGFLIGAALGGVAWQGAGITAAPAGLALATLAMAGASWTIPEVQAGPRDAPPARLGALLRTPGFLPVLLVAFLHQTTLCGYDLYFSVHCAALGHSTLVTGAGWSFGVLCEVFLLRRGSSLLARHSPRTWILIGISLASLRWGLLSLLVRPTGLILLQGLHAFTFGAWFLGTIHWIEARVAAPLRGRAQGLLYAVSMGLGSALGARLWGGLGDAYGTPAAFQAMAVFELLPLLAAWWLLTPKSPSQAAC